MLTTIKGTVFSYTNFYVREEKPAIQHNYGILVIIGLYL